MGYNYYNYQVYLQAEKNYELDDIKDALEEFSIYETTPSSITLSFDGWKMWIEWDAAAHIPEEAGEIAALYNKNEVGDCVARLDIYAEDDEDEEHYNDHLYVLEALSKLSVFILDVTLGEFLYEANYIDIDTSFLQVVKGNHKIQGYIDQVKGDDSQDWEIWHNLGFEYGNVKNLDVALQCYETSLLLNPKNQDAYYNIGKDYFRAGKYDLAKKYYLKSLDITPEYHIVLEALAQLAGRQKNVEEAIGYLERSLEANPDYTVANTNMAFYLIKSGKAHQALPFAENAFAHGDVYVSAFNMGHIYLAQNEEVKALESYAISLRSVEDQDSFWADFEADYDIVSQYGISLDYYNSLRTKIADQLEFIPPLELNEIAELWSKCSYDLGPVLNDEKIQILEALEVPESYIQWLGIANRSYKTGRLSDSNDYKGVNLKSYDVLIEYVYSESHTTLTANGYIIFADIDQDFSYVFDTKDNSVREINFDLFYTALYDWELNGDAEDVRKKLETFFTGRRFDTFDDLLKSELNELETLKIQNNAACKYQVYLLANKNYRLKDVKNALQEFNIVETTAYSLTLDFEGWKLFVTMSSGRAIEKEAKRVADWYSRRYVAKCNTRLEVRVAEPNGNYNQNQQDVIEALAELRGSYILDKDRDQFILDKENENLYRVYLEVNREYTIDYFVELLNMYPVSEKTETSFTLNVNGYPLRFRWIGSGMGKTFHELAELNDLVEFNACDSMLEISYDNEPQGISYEDRTFIVTILSDLHGVYVYDSGMEEFWYHRISTDFLEWIDGNEDIDDYIENIEKNTEDGRSYWYKLAVAYQRLNKLELAERCAKISIYFHFNASGFDLLGNIYKLCKEFEKAKESYLNAVEIDPEKGISYLSLGEISAQENKIEEAIGYFRKGAEADPRNVFCNMSAGFNCLLYGKPDLAMLYSEKAIALGQVSFSSLNKGHVHLIRGEKEAAIESYALSLQAFLITHNEAKFWTDYDSDFEVMSQYGISRELYDSLNKEIDTRFKSLSELDDDQIDKILWAARYVS